MSQPVLALGVAAVTASGCVWYVPALTDLRARADRLRSRRLRAGACLSGWGTVALLVPLALLSAPWPAMAAAGAAGTATVATLCVKARHQHTREQREAHAQWAALRRDQHPQRSAPTSARTRAAWLLTALLLTALAAAAALLAGLPAVTVLLATAVLAAAALSLAASLRPRRPHDAP